jgi:Sulfatase
LNNLSFLRALLSRRDWVYLLSLLGPFVVYSLALKASGVASLHIAPGLADIPNLMRSNLSFCLGYASLWIGLFAVARSGMLRRAVLVLFHTATMLVVLVTTCAHQYYQQTGSTLDYSTIALFLPSPGEVFPLLRGVSVPAWVLLFAVLLYTASGPLLLTRAVERWRGWPESSPLGPRGESFLPVGPFGFFLLALGFVWLSLLAGSNPTGTSESFARDPVVNVVLTGAKEAIEEDEPAAGPAVEHPAARADLAETPGTEKRNVVLIHLESTRAHATTPYHNDLETTPFLEELARESLLADRYYTVVPHSSEAVASVNCGIPPRLVSPTTEAEPGGIPVPCLPNLLKEEGYATVLFQSSTEHFENFRGRATNFGYEEYYPLETMEVRDAAKTNYFGYEDDIMLGPSEEWLKEHGDEPFLAEYLLGTGHHDYQCLGTGYGKEDFSEDDLINRYLNCMRLQDIFVENLMDQYKELGLYEDTIFVIYGDHGEGFGEHGRDGHNDTIWEEGLKVPLLIHAPGWFENGERVEGLSNHTDVLPTVLEMLSYEIQNGEYPGYSLLREPPDDRTLFFSCWFEDQCLASIEGTEKYIYHYGNRPDELFDLSIDPSERENLVDERSEEEIDERRQDLLAWRSSVDAAYPPG